MDLPEVINFLKAIPVYVWVILAIVVVIIFGQRKIWEFEVKFSAEGIGYGEVEIECTSSKFSKKENLTIEVDLGLQPEWRNKTYEVFLNGKSILKILDNESCSSMNKIRRKYQGDKPTADDLIEIRCDHKVVFSGTMKKD